MRQRVRPMGPEASFREAIRAARSEPRDAGTWAALGALLEKCGLMEQAEKAYATAVRLAPEDPGSHIALGRFCQRIRLPERAETHLHRAVHLSGGSAQTCRYFGEFLEGQGRFKEAVRWLRAAASGGGEPVLDFKIGWLKGLQGDFSLMRRYFKRFLIRDHGQDAPALARFHALMGLQDYSSAFATAERLLDGARAADREGLHRPWPDTWLHPPVLSAPIRQFYLRQLHALERWSRSHASSPWPGFFKGCIHWRLYDFEAGLEAMSPPHSQPEKRYGWMRYFTGVLRLTLRQYEQARRDFETALRSCNGFWHARCYLAETLLCLGDERAAFAEFERAGRGDERAEVWAWHGEAWLWLGEYPKALRWLDRAISAGAWLGFCWRGAARMLSGNHEGALQDLDRAIEAGPLDAEAYIWRGELQRRMGRHQEALKDLNRAVALAQSAPWARVNRALAWAATGEPAAMRSDFKRLPRRIADPILRASGRTWPRTDTEIEAVLRAGLDLAGGVRRGDDYLQDLWMSRKKFLSPSGSHTGDNPSAGKVLKP